MKNVVITDVLRGGKSVVAYGNKIRSYSEYQEFALHYPYIFTGEVNKQQWYFGLVNVHENLRRALVVDGIKVRTFLTGQLRCGLIGIDQVMLAKKPGQDENEVQRRLQTLFDSVHPALLDTKGVLVSNTLGQFDIVYDPSRRDFTFNKL